MQNDQYSMYPHPQNHIQTILIHYQYPNYQKVQISNINCQTSKKNVAQYFQVPMFLFVCFLFFPIFVLFFLFFVLLSFLFCFLAKLTLTPHFCPSCHCSHDNLISSYPGVVHLLLPGSPDKTHHCGNNDYSETHPDHVLDPVHHKSSIFLN